MPRSHFFPTFNELPDILPIFPLESAVVMPGADLPLNIFEPRYLNMVADVLATHRMFGMVQPDPSRHGSPVPVYRTGCSGRITSYKETDDGRILIALTGVCRFDIEQELATTRGYRAVVPNWSRFASDFETDEGGVFEDRLRLMGVLRRYFRLQNLDTDWGTLEQMPKLQLIHTLTTLLPLEAASKQAVLEAIEPSGRGNALFAALEMSLQETPGSPLH
jgi:Lon protease-like protein